MSYRWLSVGCLISRAPAVVLRLASYFYNWPVRTWPICRPEGAVGGHAHPGVFGGGGIGQAELQAQTHQKSVSWDVPEAGRAHDPRRGN
jgi:hypothetical protein